MDDIELGQPLQLGERMMITRLVRCGVGATLITEFYFCELHQCCECVMFEGVSVLNELIPEGDYGYDDDEGQATGN